MALYQGYLFQWIIKLGSANYWPIKGAGPIDCGPNIRAAVYVLFKNGPFRVHFRALIDVTELTPRQDFTIFRKMSSASFKLYTWHDATFEGPEAAETDRQTEEERRQRD